MRYLRKLSRLSQQAFAEKVGLNRGNIASYEKGTAEPSIANVLKITKFFNVDLVDFIDTDLSETVENDTVEMVIQNDHVSFIRDTINDIVNDTQQISNDREIASTQNLIRQSIDHQSIIEGFKQYHKFKLKKYNLNDLPDEWKSVLIDYERLIEVSESLTEINRELIKKIFSVPKLVNDKS